MTRPEDETSRKQAAVPASTTPIVTPGRRKTRSSSSPFKYYIHDAGDAFRLQLFGEMTETDVRELDGCWRTARTSIGNRKFILDLEGLKSVDDAGKRWLMSMASEGASYRPETFPRNGLVGQTAATRAQGKTAKKTGVFAKVLSLLKGPAAEPTQAQ